MKRKKKVTNNANKELKNVNPNGDNVVANNLSNIKFSFFQENWIKKQNSYAIFSDRCHGYPIPHYVHFTNQHWMNKSSSYRCGPMPWEKNLMNFGSYFGVLVAAWTSRKNHLGHHNLFLKIQWKIKSTPLQSQCISIPSKKSFKKSQWKLALQELV